MLSYIFNQLYKKVGQLKIEVDWLKIKSGYLRWWYRRKSNAL